MTDLKKKGMDYMTGLRHSAIHHRMARYRLAASLLTLMLFLAATWLPGQSLAQAPTRRLSETPSTTELQADFDFILDTLKKNYPYLQKKNIDLGSLREGYMPMLEKVTDLASYELLLMRFFCDLGNSHTQVFLTRYASISPQHLITQRVGDQIVAMYVNPQSPPYAQGVRKGMVLKTIDGLEAMKVVLQVASYARGSTVEAMKNGCFGLYPYLLYVGKIGTSRELVFVDGSGQEHKVTIALGQGLPEGQRGALAHEALPDEIGYLLVRSLSESDGFTMQAFETHLRELMSTKGLILDLRFCSGGNSALGDQMARRLIREKVRWWSNDISWYRFYRQITRCTPYKKLNYSKPIVVLVSPYTMSSAESFLDLLRQASNVDLVGERSNGDMGGMPKVFTTPLGVRFASPTVRTLDHEGKDLEGVGIDVDYPATCTVEGLQKGVDGVIEKGLEVLRAEIQRGS